MSLIKEHLYSMMTQTTDNIIDRDQLQDDLITRIIDDMDLKTMARCLYDYMNQSYDKYTVDELIEEVEEYKKLNLKNVIYVEPIKEFAEEIENKTKNLDNFTVLAIGLGSEDKDGEINVAEGYHSGSSSIFSPRPSSIEFKKKG